MFGLDKDSEDAKLFILAKKRQWNSSDCSSISTWESHWYSSLTISMKNPTHTPNSIEAITLGKNRYDNRETNPFQASLQIL
jgi:hypothetical protein